MYCQLGMAVNLFEFIFGITQPRDVKEKALPFSVLALPDATLKYMSDAIWMFPPLLHIRESKKSGMFFNCRSSHPHGLAE